MARNSFGAYVASVPTVMVPSEATALGTLAASAGSAFTAASLLETAAPGEPDELELEPLEPPQAASDSVSAVAPVSRTSGRRALGYRIEHLRATGQAEAAETQCRCSPASSVGRPPRDA